MSDLIDGEIQVIEDYVQDGNIVFDVGSYHGEWALEVLKRKAGVFVHCFEPIKNSYTCLEKNLLTFHTQIILNGTALSNLRGPGKFWEYQKCPVLSTRYKRNTNEMERFGVAEPIPITVAMNTLDYYCYAAKVDHIDFLKIDVEGSEFSVIQGAERLLQEHKIQYIQFEYGGCFVDAEITLEEVFFDLVEFGFSLAKVSPDMQFSKQFLPEQEDYGYCNYLAKL